ncbi:MAG: T9SS type A sorting domain-containing protein, partial [Bacteroidia bacterium]
DEENSFNVYPNPSTDFFNLDISLSSDSDILLEVFNISGQKVIAKKYSLIKGVNSFITNVSELKAGTYFIKISGSNFSNIKSKVFIKE